MADSYNDKNTQVPDEFEESEINPPSPKEKIIEALKKPKNLFIAAGTLIFVFIIGAKLFSKPSGAPKPKAFETIQKNTPASESTSPSPAKPQQPAEVAPPKPVFEQMAPSLPSIDLDLISRFDIEREPDPEEALQKFDIQKLQEAVRREEEERAKALALKNQASIALPFASSDEEDFLEEKPAQKITKKRKVDPENPPPPIFDMSGAGPATKGGRRTEVGDFIFMDSSLESEISNDLPNEGKKIKDLGNIVAQGRMIEAVLETAIDSSVPGNVRAIVAKDVYGEAGRNILIPRGSRLYGSYSAGGSKSGRIIITWSRILRPDGVEVGIESFASDQFGRSGVEGDVDKRYGELIASALLLSSIPLVATIASEQILGSNNQYTTFVDPQTGLITTTSDPLVDATKRFSDEISKTTEQVVKGLIDTSVTVRLAQGTRIRVMVNRDIKLSRYKAVTSLNTTVTGSSQ